MSQGSLNPKISFLGQKVWPVAREQTDRRTHTKVKTEGTLSGFQEFFLQPIIKDRPKNMNSTPTRYTAGRDSAIPSPPSGEPAAAAAQPGHPVVQLRPHSSVGENKNEKNLTAV